MCFPTQKEIGMFSCMLHLVMNMMSRGAACIVLLFISLEKYLLTYFQKCSELPEVVSVTPNQQHELMTTRSWDFLGLNYQPPGELLRRTNYGEDIIIGIIDTGQSFIFSKSNCKILEA